MISGYTCDYNEENVQQILANQILLQHQKNMMGMLDVNKLIFDAAGVIHGEKGRGHTYSHR